MYRHHRRPESTRALAKSAYRIAKQSLKEQDEEPKYFDIRVQNLSVPSTGTTPAIINLPGRGEGQSQRIGDSIKNLNLTIRWWWALDTIAYAACRLIIFWDESNTVGAPLDLLEDNTATYGITSPKAWDNRFDSHILYDKTVEFNSPTTANDGHSRVYKKVIKIDKHTQFFDPTTSPPPVTPVATGALRYMFISDSAVANSVLANLYFRLTYTDS